QALARQTIEAFEGYDYVVAPSGSCAGMLKVHYPELLADDAQWKPRAAAFAARVHELVSFLVNVRGLTRVDARFAARVTYHDACSGLRELGIRGEPRQLLRSVEGLELVEMTDPHVCCGFGGTFSVKYPDISNAIVSRKADDLGCLMNMAGKLSRRGSRVAVRHVAEVLAGELGEPAICSRPGARP